MALGGYTPPPSSGANKPARPFSPPCETCGHRRDKHGFFLEGDNFVDQPCQGGVGYFCGCGGGWRTWAELYPAARSTSSRPVVGVDGRIQAKPVRHLNRDTGKWIDMRSTLEGRWAVFFDYLSIKWVYEPNRYPVSDESGETRTTYLPDFWLPEHEVWVEVKGKATEQDLELLLLASNPYCGLPGSEVKHGPRIVMLGQVPKVDYGWMVWQHVLSWASSGNYGPGVITQLFSFERDKLFGGWSEVWSDPPVGVWHSDQKVNLAQGSLWNFDAYVNAEAWPQDAAHPEVVRAYQAARSAKFMPATQPNGSGK